MRFSFRSWEKRLTVLFLVGGTFYLPSNRDCWLTTLLGHVLKYSRGCMDMMLFRKLRMQLREMGRFLNQFCNPYWLLFGPWFIIWHNTQIDIIQQAAL